MEKRPKVSFVIINYNYGLYVEQAISSVMSQDYADFECYVIDNNSTDTSREVIARLKIPTTGFGWNISTPTSTRWVRSCMSSTGCPATWSALSMPTTSSLQIMRPSTSNCTSTVPGGWR
ncbi:glycosyltransferase family 2 protein [Mesorhizobium shangrilense]|uniref:Glycosyltransferase n=1 Tax=Mesorhizobium shangrilense TaxID=460060 RepID=A0ABV2D5T1_9HYPH